ncbi:MAG: enoyl-CoA hydratase [Desulfitobacteriaceae bacterium]|nr:enoyl-CoA hydratase [Desulfitobacteriaceae bacterium]MDI6914471.1 enoyl-CoA hydratase [Desulfitobacteriaceae bacterium]
MDFTTLTLEKRDGIAIITLDRPEVLNALNFDMGRELGEAVVNVRDDEEVRAVILTGKGRAFCSGGDIKGMLARLSKGATGRREHLKTVYRWLIELINLEKPVIAAINGYAFGAGLSLALSADVLIAAESAEFALSFLKLGLTPDFAGAYLFPRAIGLNRAKLFTLTADTFNAQQALEFGLLSQVVPDEGLSETAWKVAQRLAQGPTRAIGMTKLMLNKSLDLTLLDFLEVEASYHALSGGTEDFDEGVRAFIEKRKPEFKGR